MFSCSCFIMGQLPFSCIQVLAVLFTLYMCTCKCFVLEVDALNFLFKVLGTPLFHQAKFFEKCSALSRYWPLAKSISSFVQKSQWPISPNLRRGSFKLCWCSQLLYWSHYCLLYVKFYWNPLKHNIKKTQLSGSKHEMAKSAA